MGTDAGRQEPRNKKFKSPESGSVFHRKMPPRRQDY